MLTVFSCPIYFPSLNYFFTRGDAILEICNLNMWFIKKGKNDTLGRSHNSCSHPNAKPQLGVVVSICVWAGTSDRRGLCGEQTLWARCIFCGHPKRDISWSGPHTLQVCRILKSVPFFKFQISVSPETGSKGRSASQGPPEWCSNLDGTFYAYSSDAAFARLIWHFFLLPVLPELFAKLLSVSAPSPVLQFLSGRIFKIHLLSIAADPAPVWDATFILNVSFIQFCEYHLLSESFSLQIELFSFQHCRIQRGETPCFL